MTLQELNAILGNIPNVGHVYGNFPENQEVPYIVYTATQENPIYSDGVIIYSEESITLNLVTRYRDLSAEAYIGRLLCDHGVQYATRFESDPDQKTHTVIYEFTI